MGQSSSSLAASGTELSAMRDSIAKDGYVLAPAREVRPLLGAAPFADWDRFVASWDDLALDTHLPEGHRYRRRRHATLSARSGESTYRVEPHQPHYQSREYNALVGGIERWFEPVSDTVLEGDSLRRVVGLCLALFGPLRPQADWHIECHQFRIEARSDAQGLPTPEGVHRDGVDYVLVMLVRR